MGGDDVPTSIAHLLLCFSSGNGLGHFSGRGWRPAFMHMNIFLHGIIGFFHFNSSLLGDSIDDIYKISLSASRCLPLAGHNADATWGDKPISVLHILSGVIPFLLEVMGQKNEPIEKLCIAGNIIALGVRSFQSNSEYGIYAAVAAVFAYFVVPPLGKPILYPIFLAVMEYCAWRTWHILI